MNPNNKRIAKNTLMLYFRMGLIMLVTLYTSRVVLEVLGVEDFGIYNVVGGIVVMFGFLNSAMSSATQRFLSFELGREDYEQLKKVFSLSVTIHALIAIVIFILAETIGLWFLNAKLTIPAERMDAANWVYQFSIFTFMVNVMAVPYNAAIISHERMSVYAYVSIIEIVLKLIIVFMLQWFCLDKLELYAILIFIVSFSVRVIYQTYCTRKVEGCSFVFSWDKELFKRMIFFSGWNFIGTSSNILMIQGADLILNIFLGVGINAARGIANQITSAITVLVSNFTSALNPQITKSYASNDHEYFQNLLFHGARYSFILTFLIVLPIILETDQLLSLWLKETPNYAVVFSRLSVVYVLIYSISIPLITAMLASGRIRLYQIVVGGFRLISVPLVYYFLYANISPIIVYIIQIFIEICCFILRLVMLNKIFSFPVKNFLREVIFKIGVFALCSLLLPTILIYNYDKNTERLVCVIIFSLLWTSTCAYLFGLTSVERNKLIKYCLRLVEK